MEEPFGQVKCARDDCSMTTAQCNLPDVAGRTWDTSKAGDVARFASLGTTEQGDSGTQFRVDYLKPSGAIGFYHPDWVVVQKTSKGEVNWIIETKGRVWEGTEAKDEAVRAWCERVSAATGADWRYARIDQVRFDAFRGSDLGPLTEA